MHCLTCNAFHGLTVFHGLQLKAWAQRHGINDASCGTLNSHVLTLFALFHLQTVSPPIMPPMSAVLANPLPLRGGLPLLPAMAHPELSELCTKLCKSGFGLSNPSSTADLFASMMVRFAVLTDAWVAGRAPAACMSTYRGEMITGHFTRPYVFLVEDPFDATDNPARSVGTILRPSAAVTDITCAFRDAVNATMSLQSKQCVTALVKELFGSFAASSVDYQGMDMELDEQLIGRLAGSDVRAARSRVATNVQQADRPGAKGQAGEHRAQLHRTQHQKAGKQQSVRQQQLLVAGGDERRQPGEAEDNAGKRLNRKSRQSMDLREAIQELKAEMSALARLAGKEGKQGGDAGSHVADGGSRVGKSRGSNSSKRTRSDGCDLRRSGLGQALQEPCHGGVQLAGHSVTTASCQQADSDRSLAGPGSSLRRHRQPWLTRRAACFAECHHCRRGLARHAVASLLLDVLSADVASSVCCLYADKQASPRQIEALCRGHPFCMVQQHCSHQTLLGHVHGVLPAAGTCTAAGGGEVRGKQELKGMWAALGRQTILLRVAAALPHAKRAARGSGCRGVFVL
jgi:hypothetical protein